MRPSSASSSRASTWICASDPDVYKRQALYTGHIGDGKIFVYNVTRVVKIRTGEEDYAALQDVE